MKTVRVYVPVPGSPADEHIDDKSGIVGTPVADSSRVRVDFEGNRFGYANVTTWADRVMIAAGRHTVQAPTVARAMYSDELLFCVGWWHADTGVVIATDHEALYEIARYLAIRPAIVDGEMRAHGPQWGR